ncbi:MAG: hypothetical protein AB8I58_09360 [Anaerolineales bacterium]|jgi:hypothetical protein
MIKRIAIWCMGIVLGLFLIYSLYDGLVTAMALNSYEETFQRLEHPQDTTLIDAFKFKFSYYPATYRDEAIQSQCAYLVGEVRSYAGDWDELEAFYQGTTLTHDGTNEIHLGVFPIQLISESGVPPSFDLDSTFSYSPFDVDVLARLESRYYFWGFPKGLSEGVKDVYAVFIAPKCK